MKRTLLATAAAAGLLAATAVPASATTLQGTPSCVSGTPGALLTFPQDGSVQLVRQKSLADTPVTRTPGTVRVNLHVATGQRNFTLVGANNVKLAAAVVPVSSCDGWSGRGGFVNSGADVTGAPESIGAVPVDPTVRTPAEVEVYRTARGALYGSYATSTAHVVRGAIYAYYRDHGEYAGPLGYPTGSEAGVVTLDGFTTTFQGGRVYWSAPTGAHAVRGAVLAGYAAHGYASGLGLPTGEQFGPLVGGGYGQHFTAGSVYTSPASGTHVVTGATATKWASTGWERGALGYPVADVTALPAGSLQLFQRGSIYSSAAGTHTVLNGALRDAWGRTGWESGSLGYPSSDAYATSAGTRQDFEHGSLVVSPFGVVTTTLR